MKNCWMLRKIIWQDMQELHLMNWTVLLMRWSMEKKAQYSVIVSNRARQMLEDYVRFLAQKSPAQLLEELSKNL